MFLIRCSQENPDMAFATIRAYNKDAKKITNKLYSSSTKENTKYLAQVTHVYEIIYQGKLIETKQKHDLIQLNDQSFCVRSFDCTESEKKHSQAFIFYAQEEPNVNLDNPSTEYHCYKINEDEFIFGKLLYENTTPYFVNKQKDVTHFKPITLSKKLARTMLNLSGVANKESSIVHDPFCGFGGILYEALECHNSVIGGDIEDEMLEGAKEYLHSFNQKNITLVKESALETLHKSDAIISDLPFGKATKNIPPDLYKNFLTHIKKTKITKVAVLGFPDFHNPLEIIKECQLEPSHIFRIYIHKSLTRIIVVIPIN